MQDLPTKRWRCTVCGYIHDGDDPPDCCPVCGAPRDDFEPYAEPAPVKPAAAARWHCLNCSYIHAGAAPPELCPVCGESSDQFEAAGGPDQGLELANRAHIVVLGAGIAGVSAAEAIRQAAPHTTVTLVGTEARSPYYRLNLTKYLAGTVHEEQLAIHPDAWYAHDQIDLRRDTEALQIDRAARQVALSDGTRISYDKLILALGSHPFVPPLKGTELDGVLTLRTASDADEILRRMGTTRPCVVVGGGILGIETAAALGRRGAPVTLLENHAWLMPRQLNRKAAQRLERHLNAIGVTVKREARTQELSGTGRVEAVVLEGGERIPAELVILATGVRPNTHLARKAGLAVDRGIVVDNHLQTSDPDIYAAGDVAQHNGILYGTWAPAQFQGSMAGMNAVGAATEFGGLPRANTLKVLDIDIASFGQFEPPDGSYRALDHEEEDLFAHFVLHDGRLVGAILIGYPELGARIRHAMEQGEDFSTLQHGAHSGADVLATLRA